MTTIITRLFDTYEHASTAVTALEGAGIPHDNISLVANKNDGDYTSSDPTPETVSEDTTTGAGTGATLGTVLGGGAGLLAGLGMLAIPGIGPVVAAGWLIATATGAGVGAGMGGLLGSLVGAGVSEDEAHVYTEGVRRGGTLITVRAEDTQAAEVERILDQHSAVDTTTRGDSYRAEGWSKFDETAPAYRAGADPLLGTPDTTVGGMPVGNPSVPGGTVRTPPL